MFEIGKHTDRGGEHDCDDNPKVTRLADDWKITGAHVEYTRNQGCWQGEESHDSEVFDDFVLLSRDEGVVGLAELSKKIFVALDAVVRLAVFAHDIVEIV